MIDLIDLKYYKLNNSGFCWVLTIIDVYYKFARAYPLKAKSGQEVTASLLTFFQTFGPPVALQSDNGKEFTNSFIKDLCRDLM
jgi:transposase InsO family protein